MSFTQEFLEGLGVLSSVARFLKEIKESGKPLDVYFDECGWRPIYSQTEYNNLSEEDKVKQKSIAMLYTLSRVDNMIKSANSGDINATRQMENIQICPDGSIYMPYISMEDLAELDDITDGISDENREKYSQEIAELEQDKRRREDNLKAAEKSGLESADEIDKRVINAISKGKDSLSKIKNAIRRDERIVSESIERLLESGDIGSKQVKRSLVYFIIENTADELDNIEI